MALMGMLECGRELIVLKKIIFLSKAPNQEIPTLLKRKKKVMKKIKSNHSRSDF